MTRQGTPYCYSFSQYRNGKWATNDTKCSDPKELFESIVFKPEDVLRSIQIHYWEVNSTVYDSIYNFKDWYRHDSKHYGRCLTLTPSDEITKNGIKMIALKLMVNSSIFVHTPGVYTKGLKQRSRQYAELGKRYSFKFKHVIHDVLDYGGDSCYNDKTNTYDLCIAKANERKQLEKVGCTSPFGFNKTNICAKEDQGK